MPLGKLSTLHVRPCILVIDKLLVERAVEYNRTDISCKANPDGSEDAKWETERHYKNRQETQKANQLYSAARAKLHAVCHRTDIGFICPEANRDKLETAIAEARKLVEDGNEVFQHCSVRFRVVCTELKTDNMPGVTTIQEVLEENVEKLKEALLSFDPTKATTILNSSKNLVGLFQDPASRQALETSRKEAKQLAGEIRKLLKEFDGNVADAKVSQVGNQLLQRTDAAWNF